MYRFLASLLTIIIITTPSLTAMGRGAARMPTKAEQQDLGPAPSFRGGSQKEFNYYDQGMRPPIDIPYDQGTLSIGESEAQMMGAGYHVHVLGEVVRPGTYYVPASSRLAQAIQMAGGIAENGSERRIELRRKGGGVKHVDLLSFRLSGKLNDNPYLTNNDVVFVPLRNKVIQVVGAVKRPNVYELNHEKKLLEVIKLAGGFNAATAKTEPIRIVRYNDREKVIKEVTNDKSSMTEYEVQAGDVIVVPNIITKDTKFDYNINSIPGDRVFYPSYEDRVFVLGGVAYPGAYPFSPYYTLSQYISLAGGLSDRGANKFKVTDLDGYTHKAHLNERVNPGDTIMVKEKIMSNAAWAGFSLSIASFGLAASSTIIAISR